MDGLENCVGEELVARRGGMHVAAGRLGWVRTDVQVHDAKARLAGVPTAVRNRERLEGIEAGGDPDVELVSGVDHRGVQLLSARYPRLVVDKRVISERHDRSVVVGQQCLVDMLVYG